MEKDRTISHPFCILQNGEDKLNEKKGFFCIFFTWLFAFFLRVLNLGLGAAIPWMMYFIARDPSVEAAAVAEVDNLFPGEKKKRRGGGRGEERG